MQYRKRQRRGRAWIAFGIFFLTLAVLYGFLNGQIRPALRQMAEVRVSALVSDAMYNAVLDQLALGKLGEPFLQLQAGDGQVQYTQLNNQQLTYFAAQCAQVAQESLISYGEQGFDIPLGTLIGGPIFAGSGPKLHMSFFPETNTQAFFSSEFRSAGINQTLHRIMLRLEAQVAIILPGDTQILISYVDVPVAEQVIVGAVPEMYADLNMGGSQLNLVPAQ